MKMNKKGNSNTSSERLQSFHIPRPRPAGPQPGATHRFSFFHFEARAICELQSTDRQKTGDEALFSLENFSTFLCPKCHHDRKARALVRPSDVDVIFTPPRIFARGTDRFAPDRELFISDTCFPSSTLCNRSSTLKMGNFYNSCCFLFLMLKWVCFGINSKWLQASKSC